MRKSLSQKLLVTTLAAAVFISVTNFSYVSAADVPSINGNDKNGKVTVSDGDTYSGIYGKYIDKVIDNEYTGGEVIVNGGTVSSYITGIQVELRCPQENSDVYKIYENTVTISGENIKFDKVTYIYGATATGGQHSNHFDGINAVAYKNKVVLDNVKLKGDNANVYEITGAYGYNTHDNTVEIKNSDIEVPNGMYGISGAKTLDGYNDQRVNNNKLIIGSSFVDVTKTVGIMGGLNLATSGGEINGNSVEIIDSTIKGNIFGGFSVDDSATGKNNSVKIKGQSDIAEATLWATGGEIIADANNNLIIDDWRGKTQGAYVFNNINFQNIKWEKDSAVMEITGAADDVKDSLKDTVINLESINMNGGGEVAAGDTMYIVKGTNGSLGTQEANVKISDDFAAGVALVGSGEASVDSNGNVKYTITGVQQNDQINLVAENRTVAAAFVNQGSELVADALDVLERDSSYGTKTFAAVYGNRSKYDVNSDLKINGWSSIVGVGNAKKLDDGKLNWGVFYENGSGNYRTFNSFGDDFFRGDGSLVYNGGGAAVRYNKDNGVYVEGSLRAGSLKNEMSNALHDAAGASYGYKSKTNYYGAHVGIGKVVALNENSDLDVYGKFFHTYNDGNSFNIAGDKFEFDSITSDCLQIGARLLTNKADKWSTYYGLAYEYEFSGDSDMRAQNISAPTQSLQGSTYIGEIGANFVPSTDSPWSFDMRVRGYAGEREGFSGNVQATYSF